METIKDILKQCTEELRIELANLKLLKGKNFKIFKDIFSIDGEPKIYFNSYNIVFTDTLLYDQLRPFLGQKSLIILIELFESNSHIWVHQYFNDQIFNDYLK